MFNAEVGPIPLRRLFLSISQLRNVTKITLLMQLNLSSNYNDRSFFSSFITNIKHLLISQL